MIDRSLNYGRGIVRQFLTGVAPYESVLDLGAGGGYDLMIAKEVAPTARLCALESYAPYVDELKSQGVEVFNFDIERDVFPFVSESLDVIIINQVLEHVKDVFWILHEISRVLKPGGHLIVGVPNLAALHNRVLLALGRQPASIKSTSAHIRGYTKRDVVQLVNSSFEGGYVVRDFRGSNFYPFPPFLAKPLARLLPTLSVCVFFEFEKVKPYDNHGYLDYPVQQRLETNFFVGRSGEL